ncbi:MAG: hypothetical protein QOC77_431 [Thermoleophilaceae bacterium]|nr:hypothetical protein [Thermoleophilaceae bacterium]
MPSHPPVARILFDESHSESWTIRPEVASSMQPSHPADSSFAAAAYALRERSLAVEAHVSGPLSAAVLADAAVLVIAHPSEPKWEHVVPGGASPRLSATEIDAVEAFVRAGGGLVLLAEEEQDKYGNNVAELAARFGVAVENALVSDYEHHHDGAPHWVLADMGDGHAETDLLARVDSACFYRATTLLPGPSARVLARASERSSAPGAALLVAVPYGAGRVVVSADSDLFGDDCLGELGHRDLWLNLVHWAAQPSLAVPLPAVASQAQGDPAWIALKTETDALRLLQEPDGSVDLDRHDQAAVDRHVEAMAAAVRALTPRFEHQADYLDAVIADLHAWAVSGFERPDFGRSLDLFRPDLQREDGIEHLVLFPVYLQNASRDKRFEALIVRVPWPSWLAELERERYDNPKFVPVTFVDRTAGYDSECAVLFPESVSVAVRPAVNHFGGIFCDRESARFRSRVGAAVELLRLNVPPDAAALLGSERLSIDAYMLWDLIHDRAHSHGDLPFDPFMIRQRMPYWMYSLEELRCDLTAFSQAVELERGGFAFARDVQYAILFDRLFRFPITGSRVRNYDGLGGQLLFAYLHRHGFVHWTDNKLTIEWERVADGVIALREAVEELYRTGIDRSKVAHWIAAHELVSTYVPATGASKWTAGQRVLADESDPKAWLELVEDDEFPLSIFYTSLQAKLEAGPGEHPQAGPRPGPDAPAASAPSPHSPSPKAAA